MLKKIFRRPLLLATILFSVMLVAVGGGLWAWNYRLQKKQKFLLTAAAEAEQAGDWATVESALRHYAQRWGTTAEQSRRIGLAIERGAVSEEDRHRALPFYAKAVSLAPTDIASRLRFAELLVDDNPIEAAGSADQVLRQQPEHIDALRIRALALRRLTAHSDAADSMLLSADEAFRKALAVQPGHVRLATRAADFWFSNAAQLADATENTKAHYEQQAAQVMDQAVEAAEDEFEARLARLLYRYRRHPAGREDQVVREDLEQLIRLRPGSTTIRLLAAGWSAHEVMPRQQQPNVSANPEELASQRTEAASTAIAHLQSAIAKDKHNAVAYWTLAQLHWWQGETAEAVAALEKGNAAMESENPIISLRLAEAQLALRQWQAASDTLQRLDQLITACEEAPTLQATANPGTPNPTAETENRSRLRVEGDTQKYVAALRPIVGLLWVQWHLGIDNPAGDPERAIELANTFDSDHYGVGIRGLAIYLRGLAHAYQLRWSEAARSFAHASHISESNSLPRVAQAYALYRQGRYRDASLQYRALIGALEHNSKARINVTQVYLEATRCALAEEAQKPAGKRDWRTCENLLAKLSERLPESPVPLFLERESQRLRSPRSTDDARTKKLVESEQRFSKSLEFWQLLLSDQLRERDWAGAERAIVMIESRTGSPQHAARAELAEALGQFPVAERHWDEVASGATVPQRRALVTLRAEQQIARGDLPKAAALLDGWLTEHPNDVTMRFRTAQIAWSLGDAASLRKVERAIRRSGLAAPRELEIIRVQAALLEFAANPQEAEPRKTLEQATSELVGHYPEDRQVRVLQALVAETFGQARDAIRAWRQALTLGEQDPAMLLRFAAILHEQRHTREAFEICMMLADSAENCRPAMLLTQIMATATLDPAEKQQAEELFQRYLADESHSDRPLLMLNLSVLREHQGRPEESTSLMRAALALRPRAVELKNNLAWFLAAYGNEATDAEKLIDEAIETAGPLPALLDTRGVVLLAENRFEEAAKVLEQCTAGDDVPVARLLHLAEAYRQLGRVDEAKRLVTRAEARGTNQLPPRDRRAYLKLRIPT